MTRAIGINHVALEVADIDEPIAWYARAWSCGRRQGPDEGRHLGGLRTSEAAVAELARKGLGD